MPPDNAGIAFASLASISDRVWFEENNVCGLGRNTVFVTRSFVEIALAIEEGMLYCSKYPWFPEAV